MTKQQWWSQEYSSSWRTHLKSYGVSPAIWDHTVLLATQQKRTCPNLTPVKQAGTWFTYPRGMEGWVDNGVGYIPRWFICLPTVTHPST